MQWNFQIILPRKSITMHKPVSFVLILHCISIIRRFSFSSVLVSAGMVGLWLFPIDTDTESRRLCSLSLTIELDFSWWLVDDIVPARDFIPLLMINDGFASFILFKWNIDESVIVWIGVVKSFSVADVKEDKEEVDEVKVLSEIVDLIGTVKELWVGNKRW